MSNCSHISLFFFYFRSIYIIQRIFWILNLIQTLPDCEGRLCLSFVCLDWTHLLHLTAWPDLKQPLRLRWTETEMENRVTSNQHCCHDYVQFTPTCNQATGRASTKADLTVAGRVNVEGWTGSLGRWVRGLFGPMQPSSVQPITLAHPCSLYRDQLLHWEPQAKVAALNKTISLYLVLSLYKKAMHSALSLTEINTGHENILISFH